MTDFGTLGGHFSKGIAINLAGEVVGQADLSAGSVSFLWTGTKMTDIGSWDALGINDVGQVAGTCGPDPGQHACLDSNGTLTQLPNPTTFTPLNFDGSRINKSGQVVGGCDDTSSYTHGVPWQNGTPTDLGPQVTSAPAINNLGEVVGNVETSAPAEYGFLWSNGTMTDVGPNFYPAAINDNGVVVDGRVIYSGGALQNLNNLIPPGSGFMLDDATGINDKGQIVVNGSNGVGEHAYLLTPTS